MNKTPLEMEYHELNTLLDSLLANQGLPSQIQYHGNHINYQRRQRVRILFKAVYRLIKAQIFYMTSIRKKIRVLQTTGPVYDELKKTRCLKNLRTYLYLSKIGLTDLTRYLGGRFHDKLFADFAIATMVYDAAFDIPLCRQYLKDFDTLIMNDKRIESTNPYLTIFQDTVDYIHEKLGKTAATVFFNYVKIEHISQLMSIYQQSDKQTTKPDLLKITYAKGGISALALMQLMAPKMNQEERRAIYELGAVMQLVDDISDIQEDIKSGIQTLPNQKLLTYEELKGLYYGTINNLIENCHMDPTQPNGTIDMLCWFADLILEKRYKTFITED
ncbi:MAG: class 1 isoprenoid biosynthesis enzyme [Methanobacteriota archaeon]